MQPANLILNFALASVLGFTLGSTSGSAAAAESASGSKPAAQITVSSTAQAILLKVTPPPQTHLNFDGSWRLEVKGNLPLQDSSGSFGLDAFNKSTDTFALPLAKKIAAGDTGTYRLTYFYCAQDNSWCKRAQAEGKL